MYGTRFMYFGEVRKLVAVHSHHLARVPRSLSPCRLIPRCVSCFGCLWGGEVHASPATFSWGALWQSNRGALRAVAWRSLLGNWSYIGSS